MRDYTQELLDERLRESLLEEGLRGALHPKDLITVINATCFLSFIELLPLIGKALNHVDPNVRISALNALAVGFDCDQWTARIREILASDSDEDARAAAAVALGSAAKRNPEVSILTTLRAIFTNTSEPQSLREAACRSFLYGLGKSFADRQKISLEQASELSYDPYPTFIEATATLTRNHRSAPGNSSRTRLAL